MKRERTPKKKLKWADNDLVLIILFYRCEMIELQNKLQRMILATQLKWVTGVFNCSNTHTHTHTHTRARGLHTLFLSILNWDPFMNQNNFLLRNHAS